MGDNQRSDVFTRLTLRVTGCNSPIITHKPGNGVMRTNKGALLCQHLDKLVVLATVAQKYKLLDFTFNIHDLRSDFPRLHTENPCLFRTMPGLRSDIS